MYVQATYYYMVCMSIRCIVTISWEGSQLSSVTCHLFVSVNFHPTKKSISESISSALYCPYAYAHGHKEDACDDI
jgi:hypothetical protein